jgi:N-acetylneuraminic acid mutarotase
MAHDVFISHSSKDKSVADAICAVLEAAGIRCWIAPRDILPGTPWAEAIAEAIAASRVFILVFSRTSNNSDDVFREISLAAMNGTPIVCFRIDDLEPTRRMEYYLKPTHWLDAIDSPRLARIQDLAETVQLLLERAPLPPRVEPPKPSWKRWARTRRNWGLVLAAILLIAAAGGGTTWATMQHSSVLPTSSTTVATTSPGTFATTSSSTLANASSSTLTTTSPSTFATTANSDTASSSSLVPNHDIWTKLSPSGDLPSARNSHCMVYVSTSGKVILFGGMNIDSDAYFGDTWTYDPAANTWTNLKPAGEVPSARAYHAMVYDSASGKVILFGGMDSATFQNDTWTYDPAANTWTNLKPAGEVPSARAYHAMVYDSASGKVILFGGFDGTDLNDTWTYDPTANAWTNLHPTGSLPPARESHAMVYVSTSGKVILFGGFDGTDLNDTWTYDPTANAWTSLKPTGDLPSARSYHSTVYASTSGKLILFGGGDRSNLIGDFWAYNPTASTWTNLKPAGGLPSARVWHSMVYDSTSGKVILFGGFDGTDLNDTWTYGGKDRT